MKKKQSYAQSIEKVREACNQLRAKKGDIYEKWKARLKASINKL